MEKSLLSVSALETVMENLIGNIPVTRFSLIKMYLGDEQAQVVSALLEKMNGIHDLNLMKNWLGSNGIHQILNELPKESIEEIVVSQNVRSCTLFGEDILGLLSRGTDGAMILVQKQRQPPLRLILKQCINHRPGLHPLLVRLPCRLYPLSPHLDRKKK